jgi:hypothetical protein
MIRRSLGPAARARTMQTIEKGKERTRYPLVMALTIMKDLQMDIFQSNYLCLL